MFSLTEQRVGITDPLLRSGGCTISTLNHDWQLCRMSRRHRPAREMPACDRSPTRSCRSNRRLWHAYGSGWRPQATSQHRQRPCWPLRQHGLLGAALLGDGACSSCKKCARRGSSWRSNGACYRKSATVVTRAIAWRVSLRSPICDAEAGAPSSWSWDFRLLPVHTPY